MAPCKEFGDLLINLQAGWTKAEQSTSVSVLKMKEVVLEVEEVGHA